MIKPVFIVAFSGHRPNQSAGRTERELEACASRLRQVFEALRERANQVGGELHLVVSLAAGADVIACEMAISLGIPIHLVIPHQEAIFLESYRHTDALNPPARTHFRRWPIVWVPLRMILRAFFAARLPSRSPATRWRQSLLPRSPPIITF